MLLQMSLCSETNLCNENHAHMNGIEILIKIVYPEITTRKVAHTTDSKWTLYSITIYIYINILHAGQQAATNFANSLSNFCIDIVIVAPVPITELPYVYMTVYVYVIVYAYAYAMAYAIHTSIIRRFRHAVIRGVP